MKRNLVAALASLTLLTLPSGPASGGLSPVDPEFQINIFTTGRQG